jgi:hypothetical protein
MNVILATIKRKRKNGKTRLIQTNPLTTNNYSALAAGAGLLSTTGLGVGVSFGVGSAEDPDVELFESVL